MRTVPGIVPLLASLVAAAVVPMEAAASLGGYTGASTTGCGNCHGASADTNIALTLSGPTTRAPNELGNYSLTATRSGVVSQNMGLDVSTSDGSGLGLVGGQSTKLSGAELTHSAPRAFSSPGTYLFTFTMPPGAAPGTSHELRAALAIVGTGWRTTTLTVYVPPVAPASVSATGPTLGSVDLSWSGGGPQYRVVYKAGASAPASETDGTIMDVGTSTSTTVSGLTSGTQYSFAVYSVITGPAIFSPAAATTTATTSSSVSFPAAQVSAGGNFTCALTATGAVKCWGANGSGQLGNNTTTPEARPIAVSGLASGVVALAAGFHHACALTTAGGVKCWGRNDLGQLGDGTTTQRPTPVDVSGLTSGVAAIAAGLHHACALTAAGGVKCWGSGTSGQLGDNAGVNRLAPVDVSGLASGVIAITGGGAHTCAVTAGGAAKCWGANADGQVGDNTATDRLVPVDVSGLAGGIAEIAAGATHTCVRTGGGAAKCWGRNNFGQVGDGSQTNRSVATDVSGLATGVAGIAAGNQHSCALLTTGAIRCWGNNDNAAVGDLTNNNNRLVPTATYGLSSGMSAVSGGAAHSCALTTGGGLRCWGDNFSGQVGDGSTNNIRVAPIEVAQFTGGVVDAVAGGNHSCAITAEGGAIRCWGNNGNGQVGDTTTTQRETATEVAGLLRGAVAIAAGFEHSCALTAGGGVKCWGRNNVGQLGDATTTQRTAPVDVSGLTSGVAAITVGFRHACALTTGGGVKCWGSGTSGELGNNATTDQPAPVDVSGLASGVVAVSAGAAHTCALLAGGGMKCWGDNTYGQLGDNTTTQRLLPTDVSGLSSGVADIAVGGSHTCALTAAGGVKCWGWNNYGMIGDNTQVDRHSPVDVPGLASGVAAIAAGNIHTCAVMSAGTVKCWGNNGNGQVGDNTQANNRLVPTDVLYLASGMVAVSAGGSHTCAYSASGGMSCWGNNFNGQLGDGAATNRPTPLGVLGLEGTQSIAFAPPAAGSVGAPINLSATASSGSAVQFDTWTPATCSVSGSTLTPSAPGICGVRAVQAGNAVYPAAARTRLIAISTATIVNYNLVLEGWQQVSPYVATSATGSGTASFNVSTKQLTFNLSYSGLSSAETAAHIHGPAARGANAGVLVALSGANPKVDVVTLTAQQETQLSAGQLYVNIHTSTYPNGELRAQIDNLGATTTRALTVTKSGTGTGTVTGTTEAGTVVNCGSDCAEAIPDGKVVTLTAAAGGSSVFSGWSGACTGTGQCQVTMDAAKAVNAAFAPAGSAPAVSLGTTSLVFGSQSMGTTSPAMQVTVTNTGGATLAVTSVTSNNAQFAASHDCASVAPSATCTVSATFTPAVAAGAINSTTAVTGTLSISSNATGSPHAVSLSGTAEKSLVSHYYRSILRRAPDPGGKTFWQNEAARVVSLGASVNEVWFALSAAFYVSAEYAAFNRNNTGFVTDLYTTFFNRLPDPGGQSFWVSNLDQGMPREVALAEFLFSAEFRNFTQAIFGNTAVRAEIDMVMDFYRGLLARLPDDAGFAFWRDRFRAAQCQGQAAVVSEVEAISSSFALSTEYSGRQRSNAQYVGDLYNAFLRRGGDLAGVQFWIGRLGQGMTREALRVEFKNSPEFQARVNAVIAQGCLP